MKTFYLDFRGYWNNSTRDYFPSYPGIYCIYRSSFDWVSQKQRPTQLLYIGEALHAKTEILDHELKTKWESFLKKDEELLYTYAPLVQDRKQALAALVFRHRPIGNAEYKYYFPYDLTGITLAGKVRFLQIAFTVPDDVESANPSRAA